MKVERNPARVLEGIHQTLDARYRSASTGSSTLAGTVCKGDADPLDCGTCLKSAKLLKKLSNDDWECSHIECPQRRHCWSAGTGDAPYVAPVKKADPFNAMFDNPEV